MKIDYQMLIAHSIVFTLAVALMASIAFCIYLVSLLVGVVL